MRKHDLYIYYTLIIITIIFTICDLVVSYSQLLTASLIFSSLTMVVGFVGKNKASVLKADSQVDETIKFIKSNFNNKNTILSILDVLCCIVAFFTGVFLVAAISRSVMAIRLIVIINKYKTVAFGIWSFVFVYLFKRGAKKMENKNKFVETIKKSIKWLWCNKKSLLASLISVLFGIASAIVINAETILSLPRFEVFGINLTAIIIGVLVFAGVEIGVAGKGFETIAEALSRIKVEKDEKEKREIEKIAKKEIIAAKKEKAKIEAQNQNAEKENSKKKIEEEAKAKEEAEFRARVEAVKAELLKKENNQ